MMFTSEIIQKIVERGNEVQVKKDSEEAKVLFIEDSLLLRNCLFNNFYVDSGCSVEMRKSLCDTWMSLQA